MNQIKIGLFIANLRKEQEMTQKQLAERIGVSDKTISKWECGNGLPELSSIPILCEVLDINMNELLSGERLAEEVYSKKAEENMMTLMKETTEQKKKNKSALLTILLGILALVAAFLLGNIHILMQGFSMWALFDMETILMTVVPAGLILVAAGQGKSFLRAFAMLGEKKVYTGEERKKAVKAVKLVMNAMLSLGVLTSVMSFVYLAAYLEMGMTWEGLLANIAVASYGILYGLTAFVLLLPIRGRLESRITE
ncbi:MAG: helix-turn-helix domain-containing protein [Lachnospiraceae bacterium]|nr:helix-turn-helix domain-containing protein [Lachnospiraceae bacterium]